MSINDEHPASDAWRPEPGWEEARAAVNGGPTADDEGADDDPGNPHVPPPRGRTAPRSTVVEVQFRRSAADLASALALGVEAFFAGDAASASPGGAAVQEILANHGLQASEYSFARPSLEAEDQRLIAMAAAGGTAPPDPFAGLSPLRSFVRLRFPTPLAAAQAARELQVLTEVERAVPVPNAAPPQAPAAPPLPTDTLIGTPGQKVDPSPATNGRRPQWYLHRTSVPDAWAQGARGAGVVIADVDWGFRVTHQELQGRLEKVHNTFNNDTEVSVGDKVRHGTAVLGLAGAAADGRGMAGYAPEAALWAIQGNGGTGESSEQGWHNAIEYVRAEDSGGRRKVLILEVETESGGNYEQLPSVRVAIERAIAEKVVVCVAAGNGDAPADLEDDGVTPIPPTGSILVGATEWDSQENPRASFSNWGSRVVVSAPGSRCFDVTCGPSRDDQYINKFGGTSGATAKVAGAVALMLSVNPDLSHCDVREILRGTGTPITPDPAAPHKQIGVFLNAGAAVREALRRAQGGAPGTGHIEGLARRSPVDGWMGADPANPQPAPVPDRTLREFRRSTEGVMTREQQQLAIDQAIQLLELFYVHRPLKEAMHAVRPVQRLRVLRRRLEEEPDAWTGRQELRLHNLLTDVFLSVRDLHTSYLLPQPYRDYTAFLPFLVRPFIDSGGTRRYLVTRVVDDFTFPNPDFGREAEILTWNGVDIETAVEMNAQQTAGSNLAARHARGVDALTVRPMNVALPPEADWVNVTFRRDDGPVQEMRQDWLVRFTPLDELEAASRAGFAPVSKRVPGVPVMDSVAADDGDAGRGAGTPPAPRAAVRVIQQEAAFSLDMASVAYDRSREVLFSPAEPAARAALAKVAVAPAGALAAGGPDPKRLEYQAAMGIDVAADAVREAKELLFTSKRMAAADHRARNGLSQAEPLSGEDVLTHMPLVFYARRLDLGGRQRAYVRIRTFAVRDPDAFVAEFIRLLKELPGDGLILDVRGNGGGHIFAAERLLQTLTPGPIEPERLQFISSAGTLELCRRNRMPALGLSSWTTSLEQAVLTGSTYSQALPLTDAISCNQIGQRYHGPVVLLVDGRCYSATDIFAAGFEDHGIGVIVGTSPTTGAGGANVWGHDLLSQVYAPDGSPLKPLPHKMGMRIAIRQTLRVGPRAGTLLEDFGVSPKPEHIHRTTRRDLLHDDADLFEFAVGVLDDLPVHRLTLTETGRTGDQVQFRMECEGITRLDFYLDGHPATSVGITEGGPPPVFSVKRNTHLEVRGFSPDGPEERRQVAALKQMVS